MGRRVSLWLVFVGLVAVASSCVTALIGYLQGNTPSLTDLLAEGDGFLIVIAITADAFGKAVEHKVSHTAPAIGCAIVLAVALIIFGFTKTQTQNHREEIDAALNSVGRASPTEDLKHLTGVIRRRPYKDDRISNTSLILISAGLVASFFVIIKVGD